MIFVTDHYAFGLKEAFQADSFSAAPYVKWLLSRKQTSAPGTEEQLLWQSISAFFTGEANAADAAEGWRSLQQQTPSLSFLFSTDLLLHAGILADKEVKEWGCKKLQDFGCSSSPSWRDLLYQAALAILAEDTESIARVKEQTAASLSNPADWQAELKAKASLPAGYNLILDELDDLAFLLQALDMARSHANLPGSLLDQLSFMLPYIRNPYNWPYEKQGCTVCMDRYCLQLAGALGCEEARKVNTSRGLEMQPLRMGSPVAPLLFLDGHEAQRRPCYFSTINQNVRGYSHIK